MKVPTLFKELNSALFIFELTGFQYFSLKSLTRDNLNTRPPICRTIYMLMLVFLVTGSMGFFSYLTSSMHQETLTAKNILMFTIEQSMNVGILLVISTSLIQSFTSTRKIKKIFLNTSEIIQLAKQIFNITVDIKKIRRDTWKRMLFLIALLVVINISTAIWHVESIFEFLFSFVVLIPTFFFAIVICKFVFYVEIVNKQLSFLEKLLRNLFDDTHNISNSDFIDVKQVKASNDPLTKLLALRNIYNLIFENGSLINDSFGITILIVLMTCVTSLTVCGYQAFVIILGGLPMDEVPSKFRYSS